MQLKFQRSGPITQRKMLKTAHKVIASPDILGKRRSIKNQSKIIF